MAEQNKVAEKGKTTGPAKRSCLAFRIEDPSEYKQQRRLKVLIYGEFGVGKTTLAGTAQDVPAMKNAINIDAESGHKVLGYRGDIPRINVTSYNQLARVYEFWKAYCVARDNKDTEKLCQLEAVARRVEKVEKPHIFNTIILDSLTEIQKYCMYQILGMKMGSHRLDLEPSQPEWQEWGKSYEMVQLLVRYFRELPMHVILVAAAQREQDDRKRLIYQPMLPGKLATGILAFLDHVGYYWAGTVESGETIRRLYLQPGQTYQAKNRFRNFKGPYIENPTMQKIFDLETQ